MICGFRLSTYLAWQWTSYPSVKVLWSL